MIAQEKEIWKIIDGYSIYEVSNFGRFRSLNYRGKDRIRILSLSQSKDGYYKIRLYKNKISRTFRAHRVVALTFNDMPLESKKIVMHLNDIRTDNHISNLKIGTQSENLLDCVSKGRHNSQI